MEIYRASLTIPSFHGVMPFWLNFSRGQSEIFEYQRVVEFSCGQSVIW